MKTLTTKAEVYDELRTLRRESVAHGPITKARDLALALYDAVEFSAHLQRLLVIDALTAIARAIVQLDRVRTTTGAHAVAAGRATSHDAPEFPDFDETCRSCPKNYALPGEDDPADTVYVETFDYDFTQLPAGVSYLRNHARAAARNASALEALWVLCRRLGGQASETPREILRRHGFDPGDD